MITIISSTNRNNARSEAVALQYFQILQEKGAESKFFSLGSLPSNFFHPEMYKTTGPEMQAIIDEFIIPSEIFVFIIPEYNGSYPGILKTFLDTIPPKFFREKKAGIIGVSDGHAGNLRGEEHLTGVLHYLRLMVHYAQPKLSDIDKMLDDQGRIVDERGLRLLNDHAEKMMRF
ncbi:MAG: NAD(P)H-dependent oxidoreductase [Flavobacteriales bacterium]|nr:NAD(P)H-dependent oxidoreductase [Flavobacteriales bacterium]